MIVDAGADGVTVTALDAAGHHPQHRVGRVARCRGRRVDRVLRGAARNARTVFRILASAEAVGVSWASLDMAVEYAKVREQFGRTIGTFQAVKHHAANMLVDAEETTAATWDAARADDLDSAWFAAASPRRTRSGPRSSTRRTTFSCTAASASPGSMTPPVPAPGPHAGRADGDGADPLLDVVEGQRSGQAHGASFTLPAGSRGSTATRRARPSPRSAALPADQQRDFLVDSGYLVPHWPEPWGRGADVLEQLVIEEEFARRPAARTWASPAG